MDFQHTSKADWLAQITRDLKGQSADSLQWAWAEGLTFDPLVCADDEGHLFQRHYLPSEGWSVCESVTDIDAGTANRAALTALESGANALSFLVDDRTDLSTLLQGIYLDFVSLHFSGDAAPAALLSRLSDYAATQSLSLQQLKGSIRFDPALHAAQQPFTDWRYAAELVQWAAQHAPQWQVITLAQGPDLGAVAALSDLLRRGNECLRQLQQQGVEPAIAARSIGFQWHIGPLYFVEIARLRAFRLAWLNVLKGWQVPVAAPSIAIEFDAHAYNSDVYVNMVRATSMALSAVVGGARRITVAPFDQYQPTERPPAFGRRIARNVLHLLQLESGLQAVGDPSSGSYYIEQLTTQISQRIWADFQHTHTERLN
jgi:methylmalonyl-CoA mutase